MPSFTNTMALQRVNTLGALRSGQGFGATFGDYSLKVTYSESFSKRNKPVHVMLVIDLSGSMCGEPIDAVMEAVEEISSWLTHKNDTLSMWTFNDKVLNKLKPTRSSKVDFDRLRRAVKEHVGGSTRLNDALYTVCTAWDNVKVKQDAATFMVFLTDGGENNSKFTSNQVQGKLKALAHRMDKLIFLTAGSDDDEVTYLNELLEDVPSDKYVVRSADNNGKQHIRELFGFAQEVIEKVLVQYYHKGKKVASSNFVAHGGGKQRDLAEAALQDINTKMKQNHVSIEFY